MAVAIKILGDMPPLVQDAKPNSTLIMAMDVYAIHRWGDETNRMLWLDDDTEWRYMYSKHACRTNTAKAIKGMTQSNATTVIPNPLPTKPLVMVKSMLALDKK